VGLERPELTDVDLERLEDLAALGDLRRRVAALLHDLPADARRALDLRVVQELGYDAVAAALGVSEQTARARVSRALRALAGRLADAEEARRA
jgi:RNA polymerase sigma-70 factor (ECF subfamily)